MKLFGQVVGWLFVAAALVVAFAYAADLVMPVMHP